MEEEKRNPISIPHISMLRYVLTIKKKFPEIPEEFWIGMGVDDLDNVRITIMKED